MKNEYQFTSAAKKLVQRANELGVTKDGAPLPVGTAQELIAASEGYRNRHAYLQAIKLQGDGSKSIEAAASFGTIAFGSRMKWDPAEQLSIVKALAESFRSDAQLASMLDSKACALELQVENVEVGDIQRVLAHLGYAVVSMSDGFGWSLKGEVREGALVSVEHAWAKAWAYAKQFYTPDNENLRVAWSGLSGEAKLAIMKQIAAAKADGQEAEAGDEDDSAQEAQPVPAEEDIAEWVGLHYGKNYDAMNKAEKADWRQRYCEYWDARPSF